MYMGGYNGDPASFCTWTLGVAKTGQNCLSLLSGPRLFCFEILVFFFF